MCGFLLKSCISLFLLYLLFRQIPITSLAPYFHHLNLIKFIAAYGVQILAIILATLRWQIIMNALKFHATTRFYFKHSFIGVLFNQLLPTSVGGDAYKVLVSAKLNQSKKKAIFAVLIDRFYGLAGLIILGTLALPSAYRLLPYSFFKGISLFNAIFFLGLLFLIAIPLLKLSFKHFSLKLVSELAEAMAESLDSWRKSLALMVLAILPNLLTIYCFLMIAEALDISISFSQLLVIIPSLIIMTMLPVSMGGWGVRESTLVVLGAFIGLTKSESLAISLLFGFNTLLTGLPGLLLYFKQKKWL